MNELKPCPFCGGEARITEFVNDEPYITCTGCSGAYMTTDRTNLWQSRPLEAALLARAEKAEQRVKELEQAQLILILAKMAWPEIDTNTVRIYSAPENINKVAIPIQDAAPLSITHDLSAVYHQEVIELQAYGVKVWFGYGPESNILAVHDPRFQRLPKY